MIQGIHRITLSNLGGRPRQQTNTIHTDVMAITPPTKLMEGFAPRTCSYSILFFSWVKNHGSRFRRVLRSVAGDAPGHGRRPEQQPPLDVAHKNVQVWALSTPASFPFS
uniref:Uncharacterized protein n=1 Tax=Arundo donax TaxID=35708 RepID=A0A0A9EFF9_ARUDO